MVYMVHLAHFVLCKDSDPTISEDLLVVSVANASKKTAAADSHCVLLAVHVYRPAGGQHVGTTRTNNRSFHM